MGTIHTAREEVFLGDPYHPIWPDSGPYMKRRKRSRWDRLAQRHSKSRKGPSRGDRIRNRIARRDGCVCMWCGCDLAVLDNLGAPASIEHVIPRSKGGSSRISNLGLACVPCNQARGNDESWEP
jgi:5-methylcytosine-specific restriction endonuclease McrA